MITRTGVAVLVGCALAACSPADETRARAEPVTRDSAGIAVIEHRSPPVDTIRPAAPAVRIGMVDGPPEYLFELISDVQPLPGGEVAVVDNRGARVALFDLEGRWIRDLGGRGDGPGEYRTPLRAWLEGDTLVVLDFVPRRLLRFSSSGEAFGGETVPWKSAPSPLHRAGDVWIDEREWGQDPRDDRPAGGALVRIGGDGEVVDTLVGPYAVPQVRYEVDAQGRMSMVNPPVFSVAPSWTAEGERVYWTPGSEPRIEVRRASGPLERMLLLPVPDRPVGEADRVAWREAMGERWGAPREALEGVEFAARAPALTALRVDDRDRVWAAVHDPAALGGEPGGSWMVVEADGRALLHVVFPPGFRLLRVAGDRAYGVAADETGVETVHVFDLEA